MISEINFFANKVQNIMHEASTNIIYRLDAQVTVIYPCSLALQTRFIVVYSGFSQPTIVCEVTM